jgi:hypothetical protein
LTISICAVVSVTDESAASGNSRRS